MAVVLDTQVKALVVAGCAACVCHALLRDTGPSVRLAQLCCLCAPGPAQRAMRQGLKRHLERGEVSLGLLAPPQSGLCSACWAC